jgi:hypothetical protein
MFTPAFFNTCMQLMALTSLAQNMPSGSGFIFNISPAAMADAAALRSLIKSRLWSKAIPWFSSAALYPFNLSE